MADHKSAMKRHRQSVKRTARNSHYRTMVKTALKKASAALEEKSPDAVKVVRSAISTVDRVRGKGIIPVNRARRYVSRLSQRLHKLQG